MKQINKNQIHTIGHSNRSLENLIKILKYYDIEALVDVRLFPTSGHNPQFKKEVLETELPESGIEYVWIENLGGFRVRGIYGNGGILGLFGEINRDCKTKENGGDVRRAFVV
ncbi:MAG TPA: DUF488 domain-containing protein [Thermodesulfobacteriota bacterium]|nr:DUF488 domain-containing protein [Thermodesulfobacteriota bacterium]